ncbi:hypothetical protein TNCV_4914131 [Trichonephila clavipes]|nr:hypothetical protein TNCV_4914131 [Trichonephila clavipes]
MTTGQSPKVCLKDQSEYKIPTAIKTTRIDKLRKISCRRLPSSNTRCGRSVVPRKFSPARRRIIGLAGANDVLLRFPVQNHNRERDYE